MPKPLSETCPGCGVSREDGAKWPRPVPSRPNAYFCRKCGAAKVMKSRRKTQAADPEAWRRKDRASKLKRKFGISLDDFERMSVEQDGRCYICKTKPTTRPLFVDHDHATGAVRRLLCTNCNHMLGHAHDDVEVLAAAIRYLQEFTP